MSDTTSETDLQAPTPGAVPQPSWIGAAAGMIAAATSLAVGELFDGFSRRIPSLVLSAGEWFIDVAPGDVAERGIETFGTNDKPALAIGVVVITLLIAVGVGSASLRNRRIGHVSFAAFGLIGGWLAARDPLSADGWSWIVGLVAAFAGWAVLQVLLHVLTRPSRLGLDERAGRVVETPTDPAANRRAFLSYAGGAAVFSLGAVGVGRVLRGRLSVDAAREAIDLGATRTVDDVGSALSTLGDLDAVPGLSSYVTDSTGTNFYRIDAALSTPQVDPNGWSLKITGMVDEPFELTYDEILEMDLVERVVTLSCVSNEVGGRLVGNAVWQGVPLDQLLERAGVQPGATQLVGRSVDDFTAGFPTELIHDGRTAMLAIGMNGEPLPVRHGFPARLVVAGLYGYVSAVKWLDEIHLTTWEDFDGFWITRQWAKEGPMKTQSRIDVPANRAVVTPGPTAIAGVAWAPTRGIERVEVQVDDGEWREATLGEAVSDETWVQWMVEWDATEGTHNLRVRATDGDGETQSDVFRPPKPDGAEGHHSITVRVEA